MKAYRLHAARCPSCLALIDDILYGAPPHIPGTHAVPLEDNLQGVECPHCGARYVVQVAGEVDSADDVPAVDLEPPASWLDDSPFAPPTRAR